MYAHVRLDLSCCVNAMPQAAMQYTHADMHAHAHAQTRTHVGKLESEVVGCLVESKPLLAEEDDEADDTKEHQFCTGTHARHIRTRKGGE